MRAYRVTYGVHRYFVANSTDGAAKRRELNEKLGLGARSKSVVVEQVEIPTGKEDLLNFLNEEIEDLRKEFDKT